MNISSSSLSFDSTYTRVSATNERVNSDETKIDKEATKENKSQELNADEVRVVRDLEARDVEVKAHEAAHQAAGGGMTGAASYTYQQGPDGKMYAIGGEVSIAMKSGSNPQESIANARQIAAAAMAPANPSPQDYSVATSARVMEMKAQQQLTREKLQEIMGTKAYGETQETDKDAKEQEISIET